jgi:hypothetical protein
MGVPGKLCEINIEKAEGAGDGNGNGRHLQAGNRHHENTQKEHQEKNNIELEGFLPFSFEFFCTSSGTGSGFPPTKQFTSTFMFYARPWRKAKMLFAHLYYNKMNILF